MPAALWPEDAAAFDRYYAEAVARLRFDEPTTAVIRDLVAAHRAPVWVRAAMPVLVALTAPLLPEALRRDLGWKRVRGERAVALLVRVLAPLYRAAPRRLRTLPSRRYVAAARRAWGGAGASAPAA
jgi:uncharacterized protein (DUF2236 family)